MKTRFVKVYCALESFSVLTSIATIMFSSTKDWLETSIGAAVLGKLLLQECFLLLRCHRPFGWSFLSKVSDHVLPHVEFIQQSEVSDK